jgi:FMN phosphatase YigB (HAD superfamily)
MTGEGVFAFSDLKAVLLDLDDTLLLNPMAEFIPAYIELFCEFVRDIVSPERFTSSLLSGVQAMEENHDHSLSNEQVFFAEFFSHVGVEESRLKPRLERFYEEEYPKLAILARPARDNLKVVEAAFEASLQVVIATNPLFPRIALDQRLEWANLPVSDFNFALVTSFEEMHAAKPNPEYYLEILDKLGRKPEECVMVGDDWERDILPASSIGIKVFWIKSPNTQLPGPIPSQQYLGQGSLTELLTQTIP